MRGAIREDDGPLAIGSPWDDPYDSQPVNRFLNHFFDPVKNRPLTTPGLPEAVVRAPDWATGVADAFGTPWTPNANRRNHFTVIDARESMFRALTLKSIDSSGNLTDLSKGVDINGNLVDLQAIAPASTMQATRQAYWATTFRALGDILHLNQDMAQPQHTRNEPHSGLRGSYGETSFIEKYLDARARLERTFKIGLLFKTTVSIAIRPLDFLVCDKSVPPRATIIRYRRRD